MPANCSLLTLSFCHLCLSVPLSLSYLSVLSLSVSLCLCLSLSLCIHWHGTQDLVHANLQFTAELYPALLPSSLPHTLSFSDLSSSLLRTFGD